MARSESSPRPGIAPPDEVTGVPSPRRGERNLSGLLGRSERVTPPASGSGLPDEAPSVAAGVSELEFRDYVQTRRSALLRTAYLLTRNEADAEDLVQSALAKTYLAAGRIEDRCALDGYVRRAIVNTHISWWRRRRVVELPTDELPDAAVADHSVSSDLQTTLRSAVDRLPGRMRAAIMLRYYDDMTEAEVAEILGVSLGTVKSTVARAVAKLRIDADLQSG
jgi:RNA polymerase sigma-70 factor (sigma-E family)